MMKICKISQLLIFNFILAFQFTASVAFAQKGLLDGKSFIGQYKEKHIGGVKEDEIRFQDGKFYSLGYGNKGFNKGVYTAKEKENKIYFEAEIVSPKKGNIKWRGVVHDNSIKVNYRWVKSGWFSDKVKDYLFNGKLKK